MAIFNSYVKLPEGMLALASSRITSDKCIVWKPVDGTLMRYVTSNARLQALLAMASQRIDISTFLMVN